MHSLFSVRVDVYSAERRLFACLGRLMMEIPPDFFVARRSVCAVPRVDHIAHLGRISLLDWQTKPCKRVVGPYHIHLACRGMALFPSECAAWLLRRKADGPVNIFEALTGLFPMLTG